MTAQMKTGMAGVAAAVKRYRARRFRRGFSLFGVLLGLGLAAVVIVGAVGTYNAAREAANRSEALVLLNRMRRGLRPSWSGGYGRFGARCRPMLHRTWCMRQGKGTRQPTRERQTGGG